MSIIGFFVCIINNYRIILTKYCHKERVSVKIKTIEEFSIIVHATHAQYYELSLATVYLFRQ